MVWRRIKLKTTCGQSTSEKLRANTRCLYLNSEPMVAGFRSYSMRDGFNGLWATGDMVWQLGSERNADKLLVYEYAVEELLQNNPTLSGVCQYHKDTLPASHSKRTRPFFSTKCSHDSTRCTRHDPLFTKFATGP